MLPQPRGRCCRRPLSAALTAHLADLHHPCLPAKQCNASSPTSMVTCRCLSASPLPLHRSFGASAGAELAAELAAVETAVHDALAAALEVRWPVSRWPIYVFTGGCPLLHSSDAVCTHWALPCSASRPGRICELAALLYPSTPFIHHSPDSRPWAAGAMVCLLGDVTPAHCSDCRAHPASLPPPFPEQPAPWCAYSPRPFATCLAAAPPT